MPHKVLTLSWKVEECQPLIPGGGEPGGGVPATVGGPRPRRRRGRAVQVDPLKPTLKAPGIKHLKLNCDNLHPSFAFKFNLRRYIVELPGAGANHGKPNGAVSSAAKVRQTT